MSQRFYRLDTNSDERNEIMEHHAMSARKLHGMLNAAKKGMGGKEAKPPKVYRKGTDGVYRDDNGNPMEGTVRKEPPQSTYDFSHNGLKH